MTQRDEEAFRRLGVCAAVFAAWTRDGADESGSAPHCFGLDAAVDVLEQYSLYGAELEGSDASEPPAVQRFERTPSSEEFTACLRENRPCVFPCDDEDALWDTCRGWTAAGQPDVAALLRAFPSDTVVSAARPSTSGRTKLTLGQYADWWRCNVGDDGSVREPAEPALYLKDLQFCRGLSFTSPRLFDDWLGECYDARRAAEGTGGELPDLRFVYLGPAGTLTPLHSDVWGTHSWSSNLCGVKRWHFVAPWEAHKLYDRWGGRNASSFDDSPFLFPALRSARFVEVMQHAGEIMFVPSGWFHIVRNETACLSVNANWANASNMMHLVAHARSECVESPQGPPLTPLLYTYLSFAAERALRCGAATDAVAEGMRRLTLTRIAHALESWPELAPDALDLARRCRAALSLCSD